MSTSRVGDVRVRIRVPAELAGASEGIRASVERDLVVRILAELERLLHARFGDQCVIRIRRITAHWRLDELELASVEVVAKLARDLAIQLIADVEALPREERLRPRDESIAMFASAAHADAAYLADVVDGTGGTWIHTQDDAEETWRRAVSAGPATIREIVHYLTRMERLPLALELAGGSALVAIAEAAPEARQAIAVVRARLEVRTETGTAPPPSSAEPAREPARIASAVGVVHRSSDEIESHREASGIVVDARRASTLASPELAVGREPDSSSEPARDPAISPSPLALPTEAPPSVATRFAGLFYLAGPVLEIDLAERLWAAGLPEGDVLAHIASTILGTTDDPAWTWFGGAFDRRPSRAEVAEWAASEVIETIQDALGRRLVRFGVVTSPAALGERLDQLANELSPPSPLSSSLHRVVTRGAAALCMVVCARLACEPSIDALRAICARPGRLVLARDTLHVIMSISAIDIDHRRAGLDQNPGRVPWLGRDLRLDFVGGDGVDA